MANRLYRVDMSRFCLHIAFRSWPVKLIKDHTTHPLTHPPKYLPPPSTPIEVNAKPFSVHIPTQILVPTIYQIVYWNIYYHTISVSGRLHLGRLHCVCALSRLLLVVVRSRPCSETLQHHTTHPLTHWLSPHNHKSKCYSHVLVIVYHFQVWYITDI